MTLPTKIFTTTDQWEAHQKACARCKTGHISKNTCLEGWTLADNFPGREVCRLGTLTCVHCQEDWEEEEYGSVNSLEGTKFTCPSCGMIHVVEWAETELHVGILETGEFESGFDSEE